MRPRPFLPIDCANPVVRTHPLVRKRIAWWAVVPGLMGGARLHNLMALPGGLDRGSHGTLLAFVTPPMNGWRPSTRRGGLGSLQYDGSNSYVDCGPDSANMNLGPGDFTISGWFSPQLFNANNGRIISKVSATTTEYLVSMLQSGFVSFTVTGSPAGGTATSTVLLTLNTWTFFAARRQGSIHSLFINDNPPDIFDFGANVPSQAAANVQIGNASASGLRVFAGLIGDIALDTVAHSDAAILQLYRLGRNGYPGMLNRVNSFSWTIRPSSSGTLAATAGPASFAGTAFMLPLHTGRQPAPDKSRPVGHGPNPHRSNPVS